MSFNETSIPEKKKKYINPGWELTHENIFILKMNSSVTLQLKVTFANKRIVYHPPFKRMNYIKKGKALNS